MPAIATFKFIDLDGSVIKEEHTLGTPGTTYSVDFNNGTIEFYDSNGAIQPQNIITFSGEGITGYLWDGTYHPVGTTYEFIDDLALNITITAVKYIADLTDTTWNIPAGWSAVHAYGTFAINYSVSYNSKSLESSELRIGFDNGSGDNGNDCIGFGTASIYSGTAFTISIAGGDDVTDESLIAWLSQYGELQEEGPTPTLTYDLSQLDLPEGTHSITVVAKADGYSNSAPSNAVEYVVRKTYSVDITFSTDAGNGQMTYIGVYDDIELTNELYYEDLEGKETATPKTVTVDTSTGKLYIKTQYGYGNVPVVTGQITYNGDVSTYKSEFEIAGDGTITLDLDAD